MTWPTVKIEVSPAVARFNAAVEAADRLTCYRWDQLGVRCLLSALWGRHTNASLAVRAELELAAMDLEPEHFLPCGCRYQDRDLCQHGNAPLA